MQEVASKHGVVTNESEYQGTFQAVSKDYHPSRTEGGQWQAPRFGEVVTDARFNDGSTYEKEMLCSEQTASKSAKVAEGLRTTLYDSTQAQQRMKAGTWQSEGQKDLGYKSVYADMIVKEHLVRASPTSCLDRKPIRVIQT
eukprot:1182221-Prorocentrum_minimum.AAC.2